MENHQNDYNYMTGKSWNVKVWKDSKPVRKRKKQIDKLERRAIEHTTHTTTSEVESLQRYGGEPTVWYDTHTVIHYHKTPTEDAAKAKQELEQIINTESDENIKKYAQTALNASTNPNRRNFLDKFITTTLLAAFVATTAYYTTRGIAFIANEFRKVNRRKELREEYYDRLDEYRELKFKAHEQRKKYYKFNETFGVLEGENKNYIVMLETPLNLNDIWYSLINKKTGEKEEIFDDDKGQKIEFNISPNGNYVACTIIDSSDDRNSTVGIYVRDKNEYFEIDHQLYRDGPLNINDKGTVKCVSGFYEYIDGFYHSTIDREFRKNIKIRKWSGK